MTKKSPLNADFFHAKGVRRPWYFADKGQTL